MSRPRSRSLQVVLLAGGSGTRFWPLSRKARPKQLLALASRRSLLAETWRRVRKLAPPSSIWVVAPNALAPAVRRELPQLRRDRLVLEPSPRDTGPAVTLACASVARVAPEATVAIFPTDHVIGDETAFVKAVRVAATAADAGALVCLGVQPDRPATGFGYLRCAEKPRGGVAVPVGRFVEKPDLSRARRFVRSGRYLWNAGMFVWRVDRYLDEAGRVAPRMRRAVERYVDGRRAAWNQAPRLSVDYAVMEGARDVRVVPLRAGWDDVGSWSAASRLRPDLQQDGPTRLLLDSPGSAVFGADRLVALVGVPGVSVVDTPDALLVVSHDHAEGVKQVVERLRRGPGKRLL